MANQNLKESVLEKINFGEALLQSLNIYTTVEGVDKLKGKISQEVMFLKKVVKNDDIKKEHLKGSHLTHFSAIVKTMGNVKHCISVNKVVMLNHKQITVNIICDGGLTWIKVIARNPQTLSRLSMGDASSGIRSVIDQAKDYLEVAKLYPCSSKIPKVIFVFVKGIENKLSDKIESLGISVEGSKITNDDIVEDCEDSPPPQNANSSVLSTSKVNLDVSAMLAYVSSMTNGGAGLYKEIKAAFLVSQAIGEMDRPQKIILDNFFEGKKLFCCQMAKNSFEQIVNTVGGPHEKLRAQELLQKITVLADDATAESLGDDLIQNIQLTSDKLSSLRCITRGRTLTVFAFGERIGAVTVTENKRFVTLAKEQGVDLAVFLHEQRGLTEEEQRTKL